MTELTADVLVLGGGPAGTWAAVAAARSGATVVLADKGYCGTSGAAAAGGNNVWYVPPGPERSAAVAAGRSAAPASPRGISRKTSSQVAWVVRISEQSKRPRR
ncbi:MAG TPA: FAD-dependent oxidoreductase [Actinoplanes sp.]